MDASLIHNLPDCDSLGLRIFRYRRHVRSGRNIG